MKLGLLVRIEAKPEYADQIDTLLRDAQEKARQEPETAAWFAFRQDATTFGVFDAFNDEHGRQAHLSGRIAAALGQVAGEMLSVPPAIVAVDVLGSKIS